MEHWIQEKLFQIWNSQWKLKNTCVTFYSALCLVDGELLIQHMYIICICMHIYIYSVCNNIVEPSIKQSNIMQYHYNDVKMSAMASQMTSLTIVYSTVYSGADQRKHQGSASLAFVRGIPVNSPHKGPVTRKMFPFDDVIMLWERTMNRELKRHPISCHHKDLYKYLN